MTALRHNYPAPRAESFETTPKDSTFRCKISKMGEVDDPSTDQVFDLAKRVAALLRALLYHPGATFVDDMITDPTTTHPTLFNVTDFVRRTYIEYLLPLLPPNATKNCKALANPWAYQDLDWKDNDESMVQGRYPEIEGNEDLVEKWMDANSRSKMIGMIISDPTKQAMFGGAFDFGKDVYECAERLYKPSSTVRPENVVKLATLSGNKQNWNGRTEGVA